MGGGGYAVEVASGDVEGIIAAGGEVGHIERRGQWIQGPIINQAAYPRSLRNLINLPTEYGNIAGSRFAPSEPHRSASRFSAVYRGGRWGGDGLSQGDVYPVAQLTIADFVYCGHFEPISSPGDECRPLSQNCVQE